MPTRKKKPILTSTLTPVLLNLAPDTATTLTELAQEMGDRTGRAASRSATLRALIRLSERFDRVLLDAMAELMAEEHRQGVRWGKDSVKRWQLK